MKKYELMVIVSSQLTDNDIKKRIAEVKDLLGSDIVYEDLWGIRPFAYPIKKEEKGYYALWNFMSNPEGVKSLEDHLKLMPNILRFLILKVPENYTPITLEEIEKGLEKIREEKAEKRGKKKSGPKKASDKDKPAKKEEVKKEEPVKSSGETSPEKKEVVEPAPEPEKTPEKKEEKGKSLDEKLDDILSDADLGL